MAGVGASTTKLVIAHEEGINTRGLQGSAKYKKAQDLISKGSRLEILTMDDLWVRLMAEEESDPE